MKRIMSDSDRATRRTFLIGAGATALGAGLAGCTGGGSGAGSGAGSGNATSSGAGGGGSQTINVWLAWGGYYKKFYSKMLGQFESEYPDYTVNYTSKGNYRETLNAVFTAAKAGNEPDLVHLGSGATVVAMDSGIFEPLEDLAGDRFDPSSYTQASLAGYRIGGKVRALPFGSSQIIMFYNKDIFEAAGLDPESPPKSLAEVRSASEAIVDQGAAEAGITWPNSAWWLSNWLQEMGQPLVNNNNGHSGEPSKLYLTSDAALSVSNWYEAMAEDGLYLNPGIEAWSPAQQAFMSGKAAMHMTSVGSMKYELSGAKSNGINIGTAQFPTPGGDGLGHDATTAALWAKKGLQGGKRNAVRDLALFLTNPEQQAYWHKSTGYYPTNKGAISKLESEGWYEENPAYRTAKDQLLSWERTTATRGAVMGPSPKVTKVIAQQQDLMFQSDTSAPEAMQTAKEKGERELERYKRA